MRFRIRRIIANLIDFLICALLAALFSVLPAYLASGLKLGLKVMLLVEAAMFCVFFLFRDIFDGSIGKKMMRLKIVDWEGKSSGVSARIRRNLTVILFPIEFVMIFGGYDTLGDTLACTCVVDRKASGVPGMKKGNNLLRLITFVLFLGVIGAGVVYFASKSIGITGSAGYSALEEYMDSPEIIAEYGREPLWRAESVKKEDNTCIYEVTVNGERLTVTTVEINDKWFTMGVQTETIERLTELIEKFCGEKTLYLSIADLGRDGKVELIEFCLGENDDTLCNIYDLEKGSLASNFSYNNGKAGSVGEWVLNNDLNGSQRMIVKTSTSSANETSNRISVIDHKLGKYTMNNVFEEKYITGYTKDENGENVKYYEAKLTYNGRDISPEDYFANLDNFGQRYTPVTDGALYALKWESGEESGKDQAFRTAVELVSKGWK